MSRGRVGCRQVEIEAPASVYAAPSLRLSPMQVQPMQPKRSGVGTVVAASDCLAVKNLSAQLQMERDVATIAGKRSQIKLARCEQQLYLATRQNQTIKESIVTYFDRTRELEQLSKSQQQEIQSMSALIKQLRDKNCDAQDATIRDQLAKLDTNRVAIEASARRIADLEANNAQLKERTARDGAVLKACTEEKQMLASLRARQELTDGELALLRTERDDSNRKNSELENKLVAMTNSYLLVAQALAKSNAANQAAKVVNASINDNNSAGQQICNRALKAADDRFQTLAQQNKLTSSQNAQLAQKVDDLNRTTRDTETIRSSYALMESRVAKAESDKLAALADLRAATDARAALQQKVSTLTAENESLAQQAYDFDSTTAHNAKECEQTVRRAVDQCTRELERCNARASTTNGGFNKPTLAPRPRARARTGGSQPIISRPFCPRFTRPSPIRLTCR